MFWRTVLAINKWLLAGSPLYLPPNRPCVSKIQTPEPLGRPGRPGPEPAYGGPEHGTWFRPGSVPIRPGFFRPGPIPTKNRGYVGHGAWPRRQTIITPTVSTLYTVAAVALPCHLLHVSVFGPIEIMLCAYLPLPLLETQIEA